MSDETLKQNNEILKAIADLAGTFERKFDTFGQRFESFEKSTNNQLEMVREGIIYNNVRFERLTAEVYEARADISKIKASLTEFTEEVRNSRKTLV